jgi:hypothetical protein
MPSKEVFPFCKSVDAVINSNCSELNGPKLAQSLLIKFLNAIESNRKY